MRKFLALVAAAITGLALSVADQAAESGAPPGAATADTAAAAPAAPAAPAKEPSATPSPAEPAQPDRVSEVRVSGPVMTLEVGQGSLIRLPRAASTVFIANPAVADVQIKSPLLIYLTAKAPGETALYAVDAEDRVLLNRPVRVEQNVSRMRQTLSAIAPGEQVNVSSVNNSLVLSGNVSSAGRAERLRSLAASIAGETKGTVVNRLAVNTPNQVSIRVKFAEVSRNALKQLGIDLFKPSGKSQFATNLISPITGNFVATILGGNNAQTLVTLDALATEGLSTTLAEPNLTATNGQPASFLAGGELPIPIAQSGTGTSSTVTVEYKTFGVELAVTPTIIDAEHLSLRIRPSVSQLSQNGAVVANGFAIPALTVQRADTTVELGSGESFVLGGLLQNNVIQNISKIPWLGDIPVIGQLFRSEKFQRNESELVIIVTPYLVKPVLTSMAVPTDGFVAPHDAQQVISGDQYRRTLPPPAKGPLGAGGAGVIGPVGFRLD
jgi:pilus assembly protein CpaC